MIGDNKLFKTVLGVIDEEGPVVVKLHLTKVKWRQPELIKELDKYKRVFEEMKDSFNLLQHPNVMPYQRLSLINVLSLQ